MQKSGKFWVCIEQIMLMQAATWKDVSKLSFLSLKVQAVTVSAHFTGRFLTQILVFFNNIHLQKGSKWWITTHFLSLSSQSLQLY